MNHALNSYMGTRRQVIVHAGLLSLPLFILPFGIPDGWILSTAVPIRAAGCFRSSS